MLRTELERMRYPFDRIGLIREKDGIHVARVFSGGRTAVLKYFEKPEYRREIENYRILRSLGIRTLEIIAETDSSLLMEDADASPILRLGVEEDLSDPRLAVQIAHWYRDLHAKGREWVAQHGTAMYDETDCITPENLALVLERTNTANLPIWREIDLHLAEILQAIRALPRTLTYNDFYYTNLIAARDGAFAFMYDYNLLGKGYVLSDVRNVTSSLRGSAREAFLEAYGPTDPAEEAVDAVASVLTTLIFACQRSSFPKWAEGSLRELKGDFIQKLRRLHAPKA